LMDIDRFMGASCDVASLNTKCGLNSDKDTIEQMF
jgi:hypothetical protein